MDCMICKRSGEKTINIHIPYGDTRNTIKDDIVEFLGDQVEYHLKYEDHVCKACMNVLSDGAKTKRKMLEIILTQRENKQPIKFGKYWDFWNFFVKNQIDEPNTNGTFLTPSIRPPSVVNSKTSTPTPEHWSMSNYKQYNADLEAKVANRDKMKIIRNNNTRLSLRTTAADEEVATYLRDRKRSRPRPESVGLLPKVTRRLRSAQSENDRPYSECSYMSYTRPKRDFTPKIPELKFDARGQLICRRTRSISRLEKKIDATTERTELMDGQKKLAFKCSECNSKDFYDLEMFTSHMTEFHNWNSFYRCLECNNNYTAETLLRLHQETHDITPTFCPICNMDLKNLAALKDHTGKHLSCPIQCSYCNSSFLSLQECNQHVSLFHTGKNRPRQGIFNRVDSYQWWSNTSINRWDNNFYTKKYESRLYLLKLKYVDNHKTKDINDLLQQYSIKNNSKNSIEKKYNVIDRLVNNMEGSTSGLQLSNSKERILQSKTSGVIGDTAKRWSLFKDKRPYKRNSVRFSETRDIEIGPRENIHWLSESRNSDMLLDDGGERLFERKHLMETHEMNGILDSTDAEIDEILAGYCEERLPVRDSAMELMTPLPVNGQKRLLESRNSELTEKLPSPDVPEENGQAEELYFEGDILHTEITIGDGASDNSSETLAIEWGSDVRDI